MIRYYDDFMKDAKYGCILLLKRLFSNSNKSFHLDKELWTYGDYMAICKNSYESNTIFFKKEKCLPIVKNILDDTSKNIIIYETTLDSLKCLYPFYESGSVLNKLFERYIGNNIIIPYNIEDRKKLYPLAFEELKDYMKDYEKK